MRGRTRDGFAGPPPGGTSAGGADRASAAPERGRQLRLLEQGLSRGEIATELFLSFHTIHSHTKSIYTRLGVTSRDEAIQRVRELDLL